MLGEIVRQALRDAVVGMHELREYKAPPPTSQVSLAGSYQNEDDWDSFELDFVTAAPRSCVYTKEPDANGLWDVESSETFATEVSE